MKNQGLTKEIIDLKMQGFGYESICEELKIKGWVRIKEFYLRDFPPNSHISYKKKWHTKKCVDIIKSEEGGILLEPLYFSAGYLRIKRIE